VIGENDQRFRHFGVTGRNRDPCGGRSEHSAKRGTFPHLDGELERKKLIGYVGDSEHRAEFAVHDQIRHGKRLFRDTRKL
jgi:hypothetical protein